MAGRIKLACWSSFLQQGVKYLNIYWSAAVLPVTVSGEHFNSVNTVDIVMDGDEGLLDGQAHEEGGSRDDSRDRDEERKARNRAALKKFRDKEKKEKEEKARRMEELRRENEEIEQRTAVHQQVRWEMRQVR